MEFLISDTPYSSNTIEIYQELIIFLEENIWEELVFG
tara:strand:- start:2218 stop:2328 length:111 start_codon:yes stop_codon:yes gene_type:complete